MRVGWLPLLVMSCASSLFRLALASKLRVVEVQHAAINASSLVLDHGLGLWCTAPLLLPVACVVDDGVKPTHRGHALLTLGFAHDTLLLFTGAVLFGVDNAAGCLGGAGCASP